MPGRCAAAASGLEVARASEAAAGATRPEVIRAREAELAAAQADLRPAEEQLGRDTGLSQRGLRPQAALDQSTRNLDAAAGRGEAAEAQLDLARAGASPEEREVAAAQVAQAKAALAQRQADLDELRIFAPMSGEISGRTIELGENVGPGAPLFTIVDLDQAWFTFNLREDLLAVPKASATPGPQASRSRINPQGSMSKLSPKVSRPLACRPPWAAAIT